MFFGAADAPLKKRHQMKRALLVSFGLGAVLSLSAADQKPVLKTEKEKVSYSIGMDIGRNLKRQSIEIDPDLLAAGLKAMVNGETPLLTEEEARTTMMAWQTEMRSKQTEKQKESAVKNQKEGETFLAENKKKEGVKILPIKVGTNTHELQYKIVTAGSGPKPTSTDTVVTHYRGTLINGTEFDSSYKRSEPATFPVTGVIKGWTEALQMMPVGSKWQLFIPSELAYGERGTGRDIGPNSTLLFDIELLEIKEKDKEKTPGEKPKPAVVSPAVKSPAKEKK